MRIILMARGKVGAALARVMPHAIPRWPLDCNAPHVLDADLREGLMVSSEVEEMWHGAI